MALLLFPMAAAASTGELRADFRFSNASLAGDWIIQDESGSLLLVPPGTLKNRFGWILTADEVVLNWTAVERYEVMRIDDPSQPYVYANRGPPRQWDEATHAKTLTGDGGSPLSNLLVRNRTAEALRAFIRASNVELADQPATWFAGSGASPTVSGSAKDDTRVRFDLPRGLVQATVNDASIRVEGNLSMAVWDAAIVLHEPGAPRQVESGRRDRAAPVNAFTRESEYRLLWIHATNVTLIIQLDAGEARVAARGFSVVGNGDAAFSRAEGNLSGPDGRFPLLGQPLRAEGILDMGIWRGAADVPSVTLHVKDGSLEFGELTLVSRASPGGPNFPTLPWILGAGAAVPVLCGLWLRLRRVTLDDVEVAMLAGRHRHGLRLSRRLIAREPANPDALFLYAASLLQSGRFEHLVARVEPRAEILPVKERRGVAYILAVASRAAGDQRRASRWAREAAEDPLLRDRLQEVGLFRGPARRTSAQSGYA